MTTPVNVIIVEGKNITRSVELPLQANAVPARLKAVKGAKYLFTTGKDGAVNEHIIIKRSGKNLQLFLNEGDDQPELIIEDYYDHPGELAGMGNDGQYHTFLAEIGNAEAFEMMADGSTMPLLMGSQTTAGLTGLSASAGAVAGGLSTGWLVAGAIGGLLAIGGIAAAAGGGGGGGGDDSTPAPAPAPQPVNFSDLSINDSAGSQTGPIGNGSVTDDARPVFAGSGTPGNTIRIYDNGELIGSAVIGDDGRWQWQPESNLPGGNHDMSFSEMNRDGVESERSDSIGFELDLTAPARVTELVIADNVGASTGPLLPGETTNDRAPVFSGKAEPGATVEIRDNGELIGTALVGPDGSWSFTPSPLLENGEHNFSVIVVDPAGNKGLPVNVGPVFVDDQLVDVPAFGYIRDGHDNPLQSGDALNAGPLKMGGSGKPGDIVSIVRDGEVVDTVVIDENGKWQYELPLPDDQEGPHDIGFIISTPEGEELGRSDDFRFDFDITAPETPAMEDISVTDAQGNPLNADDIINTRDIIFSGTAEEGDIVRLYDGDELIGSVRVGPDGSWSIPISDLPEGSHQFRTEIEDRAGNVSEKSDSFNVDVDVTAPEAADVNITDGNGRVLESGDDFNTSELIFSGNAEAGTVVYLWEGDNVVGSVRVDDSGNWQLPADISEERAYSFRTEVRDQAGNSSGLSEPMEFSYDVTPPDASTTPGISLPDGTAVTDPLINQSDIILNGQATPGMLVMIYEGNICVGSSVVDDAGNWQFNYAMTEERDYNFRSEVVDKAGNISESSDTVSVGYDITPPDAITFGTVSKGDGTTLSDNGYSNDNQPTFRGTGTQGDIVYLVDDSNGNRLGSTIVDENGNWEITPDPAFEEGALSLRLDVMDPAGNLQNGSDIFDLNIDTVPPEAANGVRLEDGSPTLSGAANSAEPGTTVIIHLDGKVVGSVTAEKNGSWRWTGDTKLPDGNYELNVVVVDNAGNVSPASASIDYKVSTTHWNLDDGAQGWQAAGDYLKDGLTSWNTGKFHAGTSNGYDFAGQVIYKTVDVIAGQTYLFSFEGTATTSPSPAQLGIEVDGSNISSGYTTLTTSSSTVSGEFVAQTSGTVTIAIVNANNDSVGNDFDIDNLSLRASGSGSGITANAAINQVTDEFHLDNYSLVLSDEYSHLDLSKLIGGAHEIHQVSLEDHGNNTLNISLGDILALGQQDLFMADGAKQMMITGDAGDAVNLSDMLPDGADVGDWNNSGIVTIGGIEYQVYQHSGLDADLLVQQNVTVNLDNH